MCPVYRIYYMYHDKDNPVFPDNYSVVIFTYTVWNLASQCVL